MGLERRTNAVLHFVGIGKTFTALFHLLALGASAFRLAAKPQMEVRVAPVLREKEQVGDCLPALFGAENGT